jgi:hypothetical protein
VRTDGSTYLLDGKFLVSLDLQLPSFLPSLLRDERDLMISYRAACAVAQTSDKGRAKATMGKATCHLVHLGLNLCIIEGTGSRHLAGLVLVAVCQERV